MANNSKKNVINNGIENVKIICTSCGRNIKESNYYENESILYRHYQRIPICKKCIYALYDYYLNIHHDKRTAVYLTCRKIDVQFLDYTFEIALKEHLNTNKHMFGVYMTKHKSLCKKNSGDGDTTFDDSDALILSVDNTVNEDNDEEKDEITYTLTEEDKKIKNECIRLLLGKDPFYGYSLYDQKFLYGDLLPYLDEDTLEDGYKLSKIIQLVINDHQIRNYDSLISKASKGGLTSINELSDGIKSLTALKKSVSEMSDKIAKENSIAVKHRGDQKAGKSTLGGIMKTRREYGFQDANQDYFDMMTANAMLECANISNKSILEQINLDDKDTDDMILEQRNLIQQLQSQELMTKEKIRKLTIENLEFKNQINNRTTP